MNNEHGIVLIITLVFLALFSLLSLSALETSIEAKKLVNMQQQRSQLFEVAENELSLAERKAMQLSFNNDIKTNIMTDDQIIKDQIPSDSIQHCADINDQQKSCYYIELLMQERCMSEPNQQAIDALFFRITVIVTQHSLIDNRAILQSTYLVLPPAIQKCHSERSPLGDVQYFYAGRQSWREIM